MPISANRSIQISLIRAAILSYNVVFGLTYDLIGSALDLPWKITGSGVVFSKPIDTAGVRAGLTTGAEAAWIRTPCLVDQ